MRISDLLFDTGVKQAGPENPGQQQLEQEFAHMAYVFLQDRAPLFLPYLLGFETVEQNTDGSRAVGVFGFKVGKGIYYIPVFFINGQIRGMDVIFSKRENRTMALTEDQVMEILNADKLEVTGNAAQQRDREDFENPNLDFVATPPSKRASARQDWIGFADSVMSDIEDSPEFQAMLSGAIKAAQGEAPEYDGPGALHNYLGNHGGPTAVSTLMDAIGKSPKLASAALAFYPSLEDIHVHEFAASLEPKQAESKITVVTESSDCCVPDDLKADVVRDGFAIIDRRADNEKAEVFEVSPAQYTNPGEPGLYHVLLEGGMLSKLWCIPFQPEATNGRDDCVLLSEDKKDSKTVRLKDVFVLGEKLEGCEEFAKGLEGVESAPLHTRILVFLKTGKPVGHFRFDRATQRNGKHIQLSTTDYGYPRPAVGALSDIDVEDTSTALSISSTQPDDSVARRGNRYMIPASAVYIERGYPELSVGVGSPSDLEFSLHKAAYAELVVDASDFGGAVHIGINGMYGPELNSKQAKLSLVKDYGLSVEAASNAVKRAGAEFKYRAWLKSAQTVGMSMPMPDMPVPYGTDDWSGAQMIGPSEQVLSGEAIGRPQGRDDDPRPPDGTGGQTGAEQMTASLSELAQQAAASGQRSVFDHATIGSLARLYNSSEVIDQYLPEIRVTIDRLGRLLFLFHWNNEEFEERYGSSEMSDIESRLKNVFKMLNDLYLQLKRKAVDSGDESAFFN